MNLRIIGGEFKGRALKSPKTLQTRPTQGSLRESLFNIVQSYIDGAYFLDLFAGSGAMGLEALSRGAEKSILIENSRPALQAIKQNIQSLHLQERALLLPKDVFLSLKFLKAKSLSFDIIYIDPPYTLPIEKKFRLLKNILSFSLLRPNGFLFLEDGSNKCKEFLWKGLSFKGERKFGSAYLLQWEYTV